MLTTQSIESPFAKIKKSNLFEFSTKDYILVLAGYPVLRAFTIAPGSEFWVEVHPQIDVGRRIIFFPKIKEKKNIRVKTPLQKVSLSEDHTLRNRNIYLKNVRNTEEFFNTIPEEISLAVKKYPDSHW